MYVLEAKAPQKDFHDALRDAANGFQKPFVDGPGAVDRSLSLIVGH